MGGVPGIMIALAAGAANGGAADGARTNFGIREIGRVTVSPAQPGPIGRVTVSPAQLGPSGGVTYRPLQRGGSIDLKGAAALASQWGRVTSTWRSPERNRRVGGVANSYHLSGRAIDIARRPNVSHAQIAEALRRNGYYLVESLDEGDHSHFAFGTGAPLRTAIHASRKSGSGGTAWRIVSAPR